MLLLSEPAPDLWERFQRGSLSSSDVVSEPVLRHWARARALGAPAVNRAGTTDRRWQRVDRFAPAEALIRAAAADLRRQGCALLLADGDGVVVQSHGADLFADAATRAGLAVGIRWHEAERGTNAIGTALAERTAVAVLGGAHYEQAARGLACYAAPVRDAIGDIIGVLDISAPGAAADPQHGLRVQLLAAAVESALGSALLEERPHPTVSARPVRFGPGNDYSGLRVAPGRKVTPRGGVLVLHDVWGLDARSEELARVLAAAGYLAFAPDLYARDGVRPVPLTPQRLAALRTMFDRDGSEDPEPTHDQLLTTADAREQLHILSSLHFVTSNRTLERHLPVASAALRYLRAATPSSPQAVVGLTAGAALALRLAAQDRELTSTHPSLAAVVLLDAAPAVAAPANVGSPVFSADAVTRVLEILRTSLG